MSQEILVPGPKVLLMGNPGDGKTTAMKTLLEAGLKVFGVFSEPSHEILLDRRKGKVWTCEEGMHYRYIPATPVSWSALARAADMLNKFGYKALTEMAPTDKQEFRGFFDVIELLGNLHCQRCDKRFGPADALPYDEWAVFQDSLTSLSLMALNLVIGTKPAVHQGEWGVAMFNLERFINKFAYDMPCFGVLTCHIEREGDEVGGGSMNMAATLGRKLAPKIPRPFSDVVLAQREGDKFTWSTTTGNMLLKQRNLAFSNSLPPTFKPIVELWREKIASEKRFRIEGASTPSA